MSGLSATGQKDAALAELLAAPSEMFNVKSFGAKGDGATDDTVAFKAASDAAGGATVVVPGGTYIIQTWRVSQDETRVECAPGARLKLPDGHTDASSPNRSLAIVEGADCSWIGGIIDGNKANVGVGELWFGLEVNADGFTGQEIRFTQCSRVCLALEGDAATPIENIVLSNIIGDDSDNDVISVQYVNNFSIFAVRGDACRFVLSIEDGATRGQIRKVYAKTCTAPIHSIIHSGSVSPFSDIFIDGVEAEDCSVLWGHSAGESLANKAITLRNVVGSGWTATTTSILLLIGFSDLTLDNIQMRAFDGVAKAWAQLSNITNAVWLRVDYDGATPLREPFEIVNCEDIQFIGGRIKIDNIERAFRVQVKDASTVSGLKLQGIQFEITGDVFNLIRTSGTLEKIFVTGCSGLVQGNVLADSDILYKGNTDIVETSQKIGDPQAYQQVFETDRTAIVDNTASTILQISVPNLPAFSTGVGAIVELTLTFHTSQATNHNMTSAVKIIFAIVRNLDANTSFGSIEFLGAVATLEQGTGGTHAALATGQFGLSVSSGGATETQTIDLDFTNNFDATVSFAEVRLAGIMTAIRAGASETSMPVIL